MPFDRCSLICGALLLNISVFLAAAPASSPKSLPLGSTVASLGISPSFDPGGNGDNFIDPGEAVSFSVDVTNSGDLPANDVNVQITAFSPYVIINQGNQSYGTVNGHTTVNPGPFSFSLTEDATCGDNFTIDVTVTATGLAPLDLSYPSPIGATVEGSPTTYTSTVVPVSIPDDDANGATAMLTVPNGSDIISRMTVNLTITHTYDSDLTLYLISPLGTTRILADRLGTTGDGYINTTFSDLAPIDIGEGTAPFTGEFRAVNPLSDYANEPSIGTWTLKVVDNAIGDQGSIADFSITIYPSETVCHGTIKPTAPGLRPGLHVTVGTASTYPSATVVLYSYRWTSSGTDTPVVHGPTTLREDTLTEDSGATFDVGETWTVEVTPKANGTVGTPATGQFIVTESGIVFAGWMVN
ncbi:hypothetical protein BH09SUM1_BH09SUM1_22180 [soil metagenome]